jgi:mono/diheme cytochrome c family protein
MRIFRSFFSYPLFLLVMLTTLSTGFLALAGCHTTPKLTSQQLEGKRLYEVRCAHCHRDNDLALKKVPPDLHDVFKSSALPSGAPATDAQVKQAVLAGKGMMPAFAGRFDDAQMAALLSYLHTGLR